MSKLSPKGTSSTCPRSDKTNADLEILVPVNSKCFLYLLHPAFIYDYISLLKNIHTPTVKYHVMQPYCAIQDHWPLDQLRKGLCHIVSEEMSIGDPGLAALYLGLEPIVYPKHSIRSPPLPIEGDPRYFIIAVFILRPSLKPPCHSGYSAKVKLPGAKQQSFG